MTKHEKDLQMAELQGRYVALCYLLNEAASDMDTLRAKPVSDD